MGRKKLSDEEKRISREKRLQYLRDYRKEHGSEYYQKNKERILQQQRQKREEIKGAPLNKHTKGVNIKQMTREEYNEYCRIKMRASRARKKEQKIDYNKVIKTMLTDFINSGVLAITIDDVDKLIDFYLKKGE